MKRKITKTERKIITLILSMAVMCPILQLPIISFADEASSGTREREVVLLDYDYTADGAAATGWHISNTDNAAIGVKEGAAGKGLYVDAKKTTASTLALGYIDINELTGKDLSGKYKIEMNFAYNAVRNGTNTGSRFNVEFQNSESQALSKLRLTYLNKAQVVYTPAGTTAKTEALAGVDFDKDYNMEIVVDTDNDKVTYQLGEVTVTQPQISSEAGDLKSLNRIYITNTQMTNKSYIKIKDLKISQIYEESLLGDAILVSEENFSGKTDISELDNWAAATAGYNANYVGLSVNDSITVNHTNAHASSTTIAAMAALNLQQTEEDSQNKTSLTKRGFAGKYAIEIDLKANLTTTKTTAAPYAQIIFGNRLSAEDTGQTMAEELFSMHIEGTTSGSEGIIQPYNKSANGAVALSSGINYTMGKAQKLTVVVDTGAKTFDYYLNDNLAAEKVLFAAGKGDSCIINALQIKCAAYTTAKGSYLTISGVRVYEMEKDETDARYTEAMDKIGSLPDTLTDNPSGVTNSIALPSGFEWISGNETVCGNDGTITRQDEDADTYLQTTVSSNAGYTIPMEFTKRYSFTVAAKDDLEEAPVVEYKTQAEYKNNGDDTADMRMLAMPDNFGSGKDRTVTSYGFWFINLMDDETISLEKYVEKAQELKEGETFWQDIHISSLNGAIDMGIYAIPWIQFDGCEVSINAKDAFTYEGKLDTTPGQVQR